MIKDAWIQLLKTALTDDEQLEMIAEVCIQQEQAKKVLSDKGYGNDTLLEMVKEVRPQRKPLKRNTIADMVLMFLCIKPGK